MTILDLDIFEADFWKDVDKRAIWDQIIPGELRDTHPIMLTREAITRVYQADGA